MRRMLEDIDTADPVVVVFVHESVGTDPVGFVDVQPLVNMVDGENNGMRQSTLYKLPYFRVQGGKNALIIDPEEGDLGLACYAKRDTEILKETRGKGGPVNPGSGRTLNMADGFYLGGFLNDAPERWVWIKDEGIEIEAVDKLHTHGKVTVMDAESGFTVNATAGITLNGDVLVNGSITWTGSATGQNGGKALFSNGIDIESGGMTCAGGVTNTGGKMESNGVVVEDHIHNAPGGQTGPPL